MTEIADRAELRDRLYEAYASHHAGRSGSAAVRLAYRRDIRPVLPEARVGSVLDIGCGQGELVRLLLADGYDATGVDVSPEQVALANATGLDQVRLGDYRDLLAAQTGQVAAVTATDLLEHLTKAEVIQTLDAVAAALVPGGVFIARVPNAVIPFVRHIPYGDFTHETWFMARSVRQLAAAAECGSVTVRTWPPPVHGLMSAARSAVWSTISAFYRVALANVTGQLRGHIVTQNLTFVAQRAR